MVCIALASCTTAKPMPVFAPTTNAHRYFLEVERPGTVYSLLENAKYSGRMIPLVELNDAGQPADTLQAWVQHYNGRTKFSSDAVQADIIIACHRESQPAFAKAIHVLPESTGKIYVYMMDGGVLIVSDNRISFYDVLIAHRKSRE